MKLFLVSFSAFALVSFSAYAAESHLAIGPKKVACACTDVKFSDQNIDSVDQIPHQSGAIYLNRQSNGLYTIKFSGQTNYNEFYDYGIYDSYAKVLAQAKFRHGEDIVVSITPKEPGIYAVRYPLVAINEGDLICSFRSPSVFKCTKEKSIYNQHKLKLESVSFDNISVDEVDSGRIITKTMDIQDDGDYWVPYNADTCKMHLAEVCKSEN